MENFFDKYIAGLESKEARQAEENIFSMKSQKLKVPMMLILGKPAQDIVRVGQQGIQIRLDPVRVTLSTLDEIGKLWIVLAKSAEMLRQNKVSIGTDMFLELPNLPIMAQVLCYLLREGNLLEENNEDVEPLGDSRRILH